MGVTGNSWLLPRLLIRSSGFVRDANMNHCSKDSNARIDTLLKAHERNGHEIKRYTNEREQLEQRHYRSMYLINRRIRDIKTTLRNIETISGYCHQRTVVNTQSSMGLNHTAGKRNVRSWTGVSSRSRSIRARGNTSADGAVGFNASFSTSSFTHLNTTRSARIDLPVKQKRPQQTDSSSLSNPKEVSSISAVPFKYDRVTRWNVEQRTSKLFSGVPMTSPNVGTSRCPRLNEAMSKTAIQEGLKALIHEYHMPQGMFLEKEKREALHEKGHDMSDSEDENPHEENVFLSLVVRVIRKPFDMFPRQWEPETYEPRIYKTLGAILRNATSEEFDSFIADFIHFVQTVQTQLDHEFYMEFIKVCTNTILHWVFACRGSVTIVKKLMARTSPYLQDQTNNLAIAWRRFRPIYSVARNRQYEVLKVLLQYGMLEREWQPTYVIISILFNPPRLGEREERCHATITTELEDCVELCCRVVTYICVADIEMQVVYGRKPLIKDWKKCVPLARYREPCELSHLCRVAVRARLLQRGRLPDGIRTLPLPAPLRSYLNLEN